MLYKVQLRKISLQVLLDFWPRMRPLINREVHADVVPCLVVNNICFLENVNNFKTSLIASLKHLNWSVVPNAVQCSAFYSLKNVHIKFYVIKALTVSHPTKLQPAVQDLKKYCGLTYRLKAGHKQMKNVCACAFPSGVRCCGSKKVRRRD
jgi:hypothetical protein